MQKRHRSHHCRWNSSLGFASKVIYFIWTPSIVNKINMEAIRSLPKVLDGIEDIRHGGHNHDVLA
jgi:hypothetical protein